MDENQPMQDQASQSMGGQVKSEFDLLKRPQLSKSAEKTHSQVQYELESANQRIKDLEKRIFMLENKFFNHQHNEHGHIVQPIHRYD